MLSRLHLAMFVTRPNLTPLGLDLVKLEGGGLFPSEFHGRTADDRPVYIHYRYGWLRVYRGGVGQSENAPMHEMEVLLKQRIGDPYDGFILLEQVCDLAGITIQGKKPELSREEWQAADEEYGLVDWSGRTTYWNRQLQVTERNLQVFFDMLIGHFSGMRILEIDSADGKIGYVQRACLAECRLSATLAFGGSETSLQKILNSRHVRPQDLADAFDHTATLTLFWFELDRRRKREPSPPDGPFARHPVVEHRLRPLDEQFSAELGRPIVFAEAAHEFIRTSFATHSIEGRRFIGAFVAIVDACFSNKVEVVDLRTGEVMERPEAWTSWHGLDLVEWCRAASDRYLGGFRDTEDRTRLMAWRPAAA